MKKTKTQIEIEQLLQERILFLDGAMGTMIQQHKLEEKDFRGEILEDHEIENVQKVFNDMVAAFAGCDRMLGVKTATNLLAYFAVMAASGDQRETHRMMGRISVHLGIALNAMDDARRKEVPPTVV